MSDNAIRTNPDVILIGAGIMSATLGVILKELQPNITIEIYERLDTAACESSDAWNNAGTGHSAFCELNYTPKDEEGNVVFDSDVLTKEYYYDNIDAVKDNYERSLNCITAEDYIYTNYFSN